MLYSPPSQREAHGDVVIDRVTTYPCDENPENTSEGEERRSTGDRFALVEEHLERGAEEGKVNACEVRREDVLFRTGGSGRGDNGRGRKSVP